MECRRTSGMQPIDSQSIGLSTCGRCVYKCDSALRGVQKKPIDSESPGSSQFLMESFVMAKRSKLEVAIWGISINAEGVVAIAAAFLIVMAVLAFYRF